MRLRCAILSRSSSRNFASKTSALSHASASGPYKRLNRMADQEINQGSAIVPLLRRISAKCSRLFGYAPKQRLPVGPDCLELAARRFLIVALAAHAPSPVGKTETQERYACVRPIGKRWRSAGAATRARRRSPGCRQTACRAISSARAVQGGGARAFLRLQPGWRGKASPPAQPQNASENPRTGRKVDLKNISHCYNVAIIAMMKPSEGRGHRFESCRARHS